MIENKYCPEGYLIGTSENKDYLMSVSGLERARDSGKILEAMAIVCDNNMTITVDLNGIKGIITKEEALLCGPGETIKDIAVITRVGKAVCFKILAIERDKDGSVTAILSRKAAQLECMNNYLMTLISGDIISAKVTHLEHFGAFVDIGCGIISLLSIDCISVSRISHPRDRFYVGMNLTTVIKSIDYSTGRIYVTHKELLGTWEQNVQQFKIGQTVVGTIRSIEEYGVFIELTPNLAGLAEYKDTNDISVGQTVAVYIKNIIPERMKVKLVLIDSYRGEMLPRKIEYFINDEDCEHISYWRYSPESCERVIETVFD